MRAFGMAIIYTGAYLAGAGTASCAYDGNNLLIDMDANGIAEMAVQFAWTDTLTASDFRFAWMKCAPGAVN
jgi:hypothetical protein